MNDVDPKPLNIPRDVAAISYFRDEQAVELEQIEIALNQADSCDSWLEHSVVSDWLMTWGYDTETLFRTHVINKEVDH